MQINSTKQFLTRTKQVNDDITGLTKKHFVSRVFSGPMRPEDRLGGRPDRRVRPHLLRVRREPGRLLRRRQGLLSEPQRRPGARHVARFDVVPVRRAGTAQADAEDAAGVDRRPEGARPDVEDVEMGQW